MTHLREKEIEKMNLSGCGRDIKTVEVPVHLMKEVFKYMKHVKAVAEQDSTFKSTVHELPLNMLLDDMQKVMTFNGI